MSNQSIQQIIAARNTLLQKERLELVKVFDTNQHEPDKDVVLAKNEAGDQVVVHVGEVRPQSVFEDGFQGKYFVIPRRLKTGSE